MYVLGIETSCDETSAAIVKDGSRVFSNIVASSLELHKKYAGIIPEIASRAQLETITSVVDSALKKAKVKPNNISLISVTSEPGLPGSLLVGLAFAKSLSFSFKIPLLKINHLHAHIWANYLNTKAAVLPAVALVVSGGHTSLFYIKNFTDIKNLGTTCDDAAGEAFDKVAKILGLGYPGGPVIERYAKKGNPKKIKFSCSNTDGPLDFSFSGIKTAVMYYVKKGLEVKSQKSPPQKLAGPPIFMAERVKHLKLMTYDYGLTCDIAASFQQAVIDTLIKKSLLACKLRKAATLIVGGGVAANNKLKEEFLSKCKERKIKCYFPAKEFCMDNAAMIAGLGYELFKNGGKHVN